MARFTSPRPFDATAAAAGQLPGYMPFGVLGYRIPGPASPYNAQLWNGPTDYPTLPTVAGALTARASSASDVGGLVAALYIDSAGFHRIAVCILSASAFDEPMLEFDPVAQTFGAPASGTRVNLVSYPVPPTGDRNVGTIDVQIDIVGTPEVQARIAIPTTTEPNAEASKCAGYPGMLSVPKNSRYMVTGVGVIGAQGLHVQLKDKGEPTFRGVWSGAVGGLPAGRIAAEFDVPMVVKPEADIRLVAEGSSPDAPGFVPAGFLTGYFAPSDTPDPNPSLAPVP